MFNLFALIPLAVCLYEILSLILPLKISMWLKILLSLILLSGLARTFLYRRTASGFDVIELPYAVLMCVTLAFNFMIVAVFMVLTKDIVRIAWRLTAGAGSFPSSMASALVFVIAVFSTVWGTYNALSLPDINAHDVKISGLGRSLEGLKVAVMVDIHADTLSDRNFVRAITDRTNALNPDIILLPGDFVDGTVNARYSDLEPLKDLKAKYGVYGVTGNHEYYFDYNNWMKKFADMGIRMLENESVIITSGDDSIAIAGKPDPTGGRMGLTAPDTDAAVRDVPEGVPVILMDHQPGFAHENAEHNVALQVSGHTHGGQMPGIYQLVKRANGGFVRGWYDVGSMKLYVSPGTSQWNGFALRLFDPAEITLFTLHAE